MYLVYNEFKSVIAQRVVVEKLLAHPQAWVAGDDRAGRDDGRAEGSRGTGSEQRGRLVNEPEESGCRQEAKNFGTAEVDYIYDQEPEQSVRHLLPRYVTTQIYHALLESSAASTPRA